MKYFIASIIFALISVVGLCNGFTYLRSWEGLPDGEINAIAQDSSGNIWMATWSGLIMYDGYRYVVFRPELGQKGSLLDKKVKNILVDSENHLWVVTSRYLFLFDANHHTFSEVEFEKVMPGNINIMQITEAGNAIFVNTTDGLFACQLNELNTNNIRFKKSVVTEDNDVLNDFYYHLTTSNDTIILCRQYPGEQTQLIFCNPYFQNDKSEIHVARRDFVDATINSVVFVTSVGRLFIGTDQGLISIQGSGLKAKKEVYFKNSEIQKVIYASNHILYAALAGPELRYIDLHTGNSGIYRANPDKEGTLLNNNILSVFEDFSGNLWIGHQGQGISILNLKKKAFKTFRKEPSGKFSLNSNTVMCFEKSANELLIGCRTGGLNVLEMNELNNEIPVFQKVGWPERFGLIGLGDQIWDIRKQTDSLFWVGTNSGLFKLEKVPTGWKVEPFEGTPQTFDMIRKIEIDENGNLWCGSFSSGLIFIPDPRKNKTGKNYRMVSQPDDPTTITDNNVISFFIDSKHRMWVGTQNGVNLLETSYNNLDLSGNERPIIKFRRFVATENNPNYLNNNEINDITENYDGKIWISTQGGGINIFDVNKNHWEHLTTQTGLPSNDVLGCLPDEDGNFWISTSRGLARIKRFGDNSDITRFDVKDGIQGDIFMVNSFYKAADGQLFFGGDNGFTCFYPSNIHINPVAPKVAFTNLEIGERLYEAGDTICKKFILEKILDKTDGIVLPFRFNNFKIGVSAIHFQDPSKNKISYYLEGYNKSWQTIPARNQFIEFVNLPFGKYKLHVLAISADNLQSEKKILKIEINPPWYLNWYSVILFVLIAMSVIIGFIYLLIHRQKLIYQRKLATHSALNTENKLRFLSNIAHDLKTPLSLIIAPIEDLKGNFTGINQILDSHINIISRNSNYLLRLLNQIIDFQRFDSGKLSLQLEHCEIVQLVNNVAANFHLLEIHQQVQLIVNSSAETFPVITDIQKVEEILYNLLSNAFKNTPSGNKIIISIKKEIDHAELQIEEALRISVFNEGSEIEEQHLPLIFNRFYKINENSEGAGIGLSYTKSLVDLLSGRISVHSVEGQGVTFHVVLPMAYNKVERRSNTQEYSGNQSTQSTYQDSISIDGTKRKRKVVLIDDNLELLEFLKNVFSRSFECYTASDGASGFELIKQEKPSVIITDLLLPVMDGFTLIREVKEHVETCHIPIILLTAQNTEETQRNVFKTGADAFMSKPFDIQLLFAQAERLVKNRELIREKYKLQNFMVEVDSNSPKDNDFVQNVKNLLEEHITNPEFNVNQLSLQLNISTTQLYRRLKLLTGHTPVDFIRLIRLQKAHGLLSSGKNTVKEVCYLTGFNNLSYFIKCFKEQFGTTPASFRDHGKLDDPDKQ